MTTHIFVRARPGRTVPVHPNAASGAGGTLLLCVEGKIYRLPYTTETRKRITAGDLELCDRAGKPVAELAAASAPEVELDESGAVVQPGAKFDTSSTPCLYIPARTVSLPGLRARRYDGLQSASTLVAAACRCDPMTRRRRAAHEHRRIREYR